MFLEVTSRRASSARADLSEDSALSLIEDRDEDSLLPFRGISNQLYKHKTDRVGVYIKKEEGVYTYNTGTHVSGRYIPGHVVEDGEIERTYLQSKSERPSSSTLSRAEAIRHLELTENLNGTFSREGFEGNYLVRNDGTVYFSGGRHKNAGKPIVLPAQTYINGNWYEGNVVLPKPVQSSSTTRFSLEVTQSVTVTTNNTSVRVMSYSKTSVVSSMSSKRSSSDDVGTELRDIDSALEEVIGKIDRYQNKKRNFAQELQPSIDVLEEVSEGLTDMIRQPEMRTGNALKELAQKIKDEAVTVNNNSNKKLNGEANQLIALADRLIVLAKRIAPPELKVAPAAKPKAVPPPVVREDETTKQFVESKKQFVETESKAAKIIEEKLTGVKKAGEQAVQDLQKLITSSDKTRSAKLKEAQAEFERSLKEASELEANGRKSEAAIKRVTATFKLKGEVVKVRGLEDAYDEAIAKGMRSLKDGWKKSNDRIAYLSMRMNACDSNVRSYDKDRVPWYIKSGLWGGLVTAIPSYFVERNIDKHIENEKNEKEGLSGLHEKQTVLSEQVKAGELDSQRILQEEQDKKKALEKINEILKLLGSDTYKLDMAEINKKSLEELKKLGEEMAVIIKAIETEEKLIRQAQEQFANVASKVIAKRTGVPEEACKAIILGLSRASEAGGHIVLGNKTSEQALEDGVNQFLDDCTNIVIDKITGKMAKNATLGLRDLRKTLPAQYYSRKIIQTVIQSVLKHGFKKGLEEIKKELKDHPEYQKILEEVLQETLKEKMSFGQFILQP